MELPVALESALGAILDTHVVASWKLTADNASDPVLVVRLKPVLENQHGSVNTHGYKRKTANQMKRDKERMVRFKQGRSNLNAIDNKSVDQGIQTPICSDVTVNRNGIEKDTNEGTQPIDSGSGTASSSVYVHVDTECTRMPQGDSASGKTELELELELDQFEGLKGEGQSSRCDTQSLLSPLLPPFPDTRSSTPTSPTHARDSCTLESQPLDTLWSTEATETRTARAFLDDMETGSGDGNDTETYMYFGKDSGGEKHEETIASDRKTAIHGAVRREVNKLLYAKPHVSALLRDENRNNSFKNIVLDRRGKEVPRLVCCSDDIVVTLDTGGLRVINFHIKDYMQASFSNIGNDLAMCGKHWPQIDREGVYKDAIQLLEDDLVTIMDFIRKTV